MGAEEPPVVVLCVVTQNSTEGFLHFSTQKNNEFIRVSASKAQSKLSLKYQDKEESRAPINAIAWLQRLQRQQRLLNGFAWLQRGYSVATAATAWLQRGYSGYRLGCSRKAWQGLASGEELGGDRRGGENPSGDRTGEAGRNRALYGFP